MTLSVFWSCPPFISSEVSADLNYILICGDQPRYHSALIRAQQIVSSNSLVHMAKGTETAVSRGVRSRPKVTLVDVAEAKRHNAIQEFGAIAAPLMVISPVVISPADITELVSEGVVGFVITQQTFTTAEGGPHPRTTAPQDDATLSAPSLSGQEVVVLQGISEGLTNKQLSRWLKQSESTVKTLVARMFKKLGAADRAHAVALGFRGGILR